LWQPCRGDHRALLLLAGRFRTGDRRAFERGAGGNPAGRRKGGAERDCRGGMMAALMEGKRGLIMGLANEKSLAWGISKMLRAQGAELAFSYQGDALAKRVRPLAEELESDFLIDCDVSDMAALDQTFATLGERWPTIDFVVHAIGFSDKSQLRGK